MTNRFSKIDHCVHFDLVRFFVFLCFFVVWFAGHAFAGKLSYTDLAKFRFEFRSSIARQSLTQRIQIAKTIHCVRLQYALLVPFVPRRDNEQVFRIVGQPQFRMGSHSAE